MAAAAAGLGGMGPKDLAATLWALGTVRLNPDETFWDGVGARWVRGAAFFIFF